MPPAIGRVAWNPDLGNPAVARHAAEEAHLYFGLHPQAESFSLGVNDGLIFGESPETSALVTPLRWFRGRPDYSPLVFAFMNRAATDLAATDSEKLLGCLAYYWCENVPPFRVDANIMPFLTADRSQGYDATFKEQELQMQERWSRAGPRRLGLYDYLEGSGFLVPRIFTRLLAENLRHARQVGFTDFYAEAHPSWGLEGPMPWLVAQLLQDPDRPPGELLDEYYRRYFQNAAGPMRRFFDQCEDQWMHQAGPPYWLKHYRNQSQADLFPSAVCRELRGLLDEAGRAADTPESKARVALVSEAFGLTERFVAFCEARTALVRDELRGELVGPSAAEPIRNYVLTRSAFVADAVRLRWTEPLAIAPTNLDDFLLDDPLYGAIRDALDATRRSEPGELDRLKDELTAIGDGRVQAALGKWRSISKETEIELARDGSLERPVGPGRRIAGLRYGLDLPGSWVGRNEPAEDERSRITVEATHGGAVGLRVAGATDAACFQWERAEPGRVYDATVFVRGRVEPGTSVALTVGWLDANQRHIGSAELARLPEGDWPAWVRLRQGGVAPAGARWVGIGVRVQHQVAGDWADVDDFSLREFANPARR